MWGYLFGVVRVFVRRCGEIRLRSWICGWGDEGFGWGNGGIGWGNGHYIIRSGGFFSLNCEFLPSNGENIFRERQIILRNCGNCLTVWGFLIGDVGIFVRRCEGVCSALWGD